MKVFGLFYCECLTDGGMGLLSLYTTRRGALAAMLSHKRLVVEQSRDPSVTRLHLGRDHWRWHRKQKPLDDKAWIVAELHVLGETQASEPLIKEMAL